MIRHESEAEDDVEAQITRLPLSEIASSFLFRDTTSPSLLPLPSLRSFLVRFAAVIPLFTFLPSFFLCYFFYNLNFHPCRESVSFSYLLPLLPPRSKDGFAQHYQHRERL